MDSKSYFHNSIRIKQILEPAGWLSYEKAKYYGYDDIIPVSADIIINIHPIKPEYGIMGRVGDQ